MSSINPLEAVQKQYTIQPLSRSLIPSTSTKTPHILWIGCSDSWITETETLDVHSEELFVVRNLGSVMSNGDISSMSALEYALGILEVQHIIVCGHYDCRLINQDNGPEADHGWHRDLSLLHTANEEIMKGSGASEVERNRHLEELWVLAEVEWLRRNAIVAEAVNKRGVNLYSIVFDKEAARCVQLIEGQ